MAHGTRWLHCISLGFGFYAIYSALYLCYWCANFKGSIPCDITYMNTKLQSVYYVKEGTKFACNHQK